MGIGGNFWDLLKPYARFEGVDFLDKGVAVDLSFWVVQHDAAIRRKNSSVRSPHLRYLFPNPSPLHQVGGVSGVCCRWRAFAAQGSSENGAIPSGFGFRPFASQKSLGVCTREDCYRFKEAESCVFSMGAGVREALCAQLNKEGHVDACITSDSDAFLYGAKCAIKSLRSNSKEPFECYYLSDIQAGLGLKRKQMIDIALLVGCDHDLQGVLGFGAETALRFVKLFSDDEILDRLSDIGKGIVPPFQRDIGTPLDYDRPTLHEHEAASRSPHCSHCGHPGSRRAHLMMACEYCINCDSKSCIMKPTGFKCKCSGCIKEHMNKGQRKQEIWQFKACQKIAAEHDFPNKEIIDMYLNDSTHDEKAAIGRNKIKHEKTRQIESGFRYS